MSRYLPLLMVGITACRTLPDLVEPTTWAHTYFVDPTCA
jgi:hypothetical protein